MFTNAEYMNISLYPVAGMITYQEPELYGQSSSRVTAKLTFSMIKKYIFLEIIKLPRIICEAVAYAGGGVVGV